MEYKKRIVDGHQVLFSADWINDLEQEIHFNYYYQQASIVYANCSKEQKILEIGIGTGLLSDLLRKRGWNIKTLDIDEKKNPDFCNSAFEFNYKQHAFHAILAFEIFEHIPLTTFSKVLQKLAESKVKYVYFSLPWNETCIMDFKLVLPKLPVIHWRLSVPSGVITTKTHFWELASNQKKFKDKRLVTLKLLSGIFSDMGFELTRLKKIGNIQYLSARRRS